MASLHKEVKNLGEQRTIMGELSAFTFLYIQRLERNIKRTSWEYEQVAAEVEVSNAPWRRCLLLLFFLIAPESLWFHEILVDSSDASVHIIVSFKYIIQEHLPRIYFYSQLYGLFYHTEEKPFLSMKNTYVCI